ncbi:MAG: hypothetical protein ACLVL7_12475 [Anaerotruncus massiliensis (ex Togo et al. 2019)]
MQLDIGILIAFIIYFALMVWIGFYFYRKSTTSPTISSEAGARGAGSPR